MVRKAKPKQFYRVSGSVAAGFRILPMNRIVYGSRQRAPSRAMNASAMPGPQEPAT